MPHMRAVLLLIVAVTCLASSGAEPVTKPPTEPAYIDTFAFLENYSIQHYLESAQELPKLEPAQRAERLKRLAVDPKRASEVFPLCRMLFEAKPKGKFRRPMIGGASFIDGRDYADWPLEPITIFEGVPILIVSGYVLGGFPEQPEWYVNYCLKECAGRDTKYEPVAREKRKQIVEKFIAANPKVNDDVDWLLRQAE